MTENMERAGNEASVAPDTVGELSDVTQDEATTQLDAQDRDGGSDLDPDDGGTYGDGQIDAAAASPSEDAPNDERSAL